MNEGKTQNMLAEIVARTEREVRRRKAHRFRPPQVQPGLDRRSAAKKALGRAGAKNPKVIAEIKFRSPSAGVIRARSAGELSRIAQAYVEGGASAVSVLTDRQDFGGSVLDIPRVVSTVSVPVLFKGFVIDPLQIDLARHVGASLVLLIVRALNEKRLSELVQHAHSQGLEPIVEAADARELDMALNSGASIIGINARDLRTFQVDSAAAYQLVREIPKPLSSVYMSGIKTPEDLERMRDSGVDAVLVGEALMRAPDPSSELKKMLGS